MNNPPWGPRRTESAMFVIGNGRIVDLGSTTMRPVERQLYLAEETSRWSMGTVTVGRIRNNSMGIM